MTTSSSLQDHELKPYLLIHVKPEKHYTNSHSVIGFLQQLPPLHLQYLQHLIPAILHQHPFLHAHLPDVQGSGKLSGFDITNSGSNELSLLT